MYVVTRSCSTCGRKYSYPNDVVSPACPRCEPNRTVSREGALVQPKNQTAPRRKVKKVELIHHDS